MSFCSNCDIQVSQLKKRVLIFTLLLFLSLVPSQYVTARQIYIIPVILVGQSRENSREEKIQSYIKDLKSPVEHVRWRAAEALGKEGDVIAVEPLISALKDDKRERVRALAAEALGKIGDRRAVPVLAACLKDRSRLVRSAAIKALYMMGDVKGREAITSLVSALRNSDTEIRWNAIESLIYVGETIPLIDAIKKHKQNSSVVAHCLYILVQIEHRKPYRPSLVRVPMKELSHSVVTSVMKKTGVTLDIWEAANRYEYLITKGETGIEGMLILALELYGGLGMAEDFLNAGNYILHRAALKWGVGRGYIFGGFREGATNLTWGSESKNK